MKRFESLEENMKAFITRMEENNQEVNADDFGSAMHSSSSDNLPCTVDCNDWGSNEFYESPKTKHSRGITFLEEYRRMDEEEGWSREKNLLNKVIEIMKNIKPWK